MTARNANECAIVLLFSSKYKLMNIIECNVYVYSDHLTNKTLYTHLKNNCYNSAYMVTSTAMKIGTL